MQAARLITPEGQTIVLSPDTYQQIRWLVEQEQRRFSPQEIEQAIQSTYGKYQEEPSLTEALLNERAADRIREEAKTHKRYG